MVRDNDWCSRSALYGLLAFSLRFPTLELAGAVASGEWRAAAREVADNSGIRLPDSFDSVVGFMPEDNTRYAGAESAMRELRVEATRLFIGSPYPLVSPYEGIWRTADDGAQGLMFVNPYSMAVERFVKRCGLCRPEGTNEPLDHIATELELMQYLAALEAGMLDDADTCFPAEDLPGGSAGAAFSQFEFEHIAVWAPRFADLLAVEARIPFYRATAVLLKATVLR